MAEGGVYPWKLQKIRAAPTLNYNNIRKPLKAPKGKRWEYDSSTKEWSLQDVPLSMDNDLVIVDGVVVNVDGAAEGVQKEKYIEHLVQPSDTFEGLCLRYKITPTELRRANGFSGSNLHLAPNPLKIPMEGIIMESSAEAVPVDTDENFPMALTTDQVIRVLLKEFPKLSASEAKAYLELNDWDLVGATENAREDGF